MQAELFFKLDERRNEWIVKSWLSREIWFWGHILSSAEQKSDLHEACYPVIYLSYLFKIRNF